MTTSRELTAPLMQRLRELREASSAPGGAVTPAAVSFRPAVAPAFVEPCGAGADEIEFLQHEARRVLS